MREILGRHFDVVVVIWALALVTLWMLIVLGRAELSFGGANVQWPAQHVVAGWLYTPAP